MNLVIDELNRLTLQNAELRKSYDKLASAAAFQIKGLKNENAILEANEHQSLKRIIELTESLEWVENDLDWAKKKIAALETELEDVKADFKVELAKTKDNVRKYYSWI